MIIVVSEREAKDERAGLVLLVVVPIVAFWLLLLFAPRSDSLSSAERLGIGALFALTYGPLMTLRIRNR